MNTSSQVNKSDNASLSELLPTSFQDLLKDRTSRAKEWKASGGKIAGYLSNNIPLEIIHAAELMPFHLIGDPSQPTPLADEFMEPAFDPITRSIFQKLLAGEYNYLDLIVLPRCNDSHQRLYYYISEIQRKYPQYNLPPVFLVDLLHSPRETSAKHNLIKFQKFCHFMAKFNQKEIINDRLKISTKKYNLARDQLEIFNEYRANKSIPSAISYLIYSAAFSLPIEEFIDGMKEIINTLKNNSVISKSDVAKKRIIIVGNGLDHPALHSMIDNLNTIVVGDYHAFGNHFLVGHIENESSDDQLSLLTTHYYKDTKSSRTFLTNPFEIVDFAKQQNAQGVIFFYIKKEEALSWHYPKQLKACIDAGMNSLLLTDQPYQLDSLETSQQLKPFIENL
ncbi:MAG: 2-hydroxyacyl-CoA dehydratase family protein [Cellvibrionaceae bacterium]